MKNNWEEVKLSELCEINMGQSPLDFAGKLNEEEKRGLGEQLDASKIMRIGIKFFAIVYEDEIGVY